MKTTQKRGWNSETNSAQCKRAGPPYISTAARRKHAKGLVRPITRRIAKERSGGVSWPANSLETEFHAIYRTYTARNCWKCSIVIRCTAFWERTGKKMGNKGKIDHPLSADAKFYADQVKRHINSCTDAGKLRSIWLFISRYIGGVGAWR